MWGLCGRSIAGIRLYARNTGKPWAASATAQEHHAPDTYQATYIERSTRVANLLNLDTALVPGDIDTITGYAGRYGVPTEAALEAMHIVAKTEGIILDPNYTGKSMSALIGEIRAGNGSIPKCRWCLCTREANPKPSPSPKNCGTGKVDVAPESVPGFDMIWIVATATCNDRRRSAIQTSHINADKSANSAPACRCAVAHSIREGYIR